MDTGFDDDEAPTSVHAQVLPTYLGRVVVADDDADFRRLIAAVLRRDGFEVVEARNGWEVLERVTASILAHDAYVPDVIVSDVQMPGVTGLGLIAGLRETGCKLPIILMTAFAAERVREETSGFGACVVFEKPIDIDAVRAAVLLANAASAAHLTEVA